MSFTVGFLDDGRVLEWSATDDGVIATERDNSTPRFHVASRSPTTDIDLTALRTLYYPLWTWNADAGRVRARRRSSRARTRGDGRARYHRPYVRLLLRHAVGDHAAGGDFGYGRVTDREHGLCDGLCERVAHRSARILIPFAFPVVLAGTIGIIVATVRYDGARILSAPWVGFYGVASFLAMYGSIIHISLQITAAVVIVAVLAHAKYVVGYDISVESESVALD